MRLRALFIALGLVSANPAHAAYIIEVQQVGNNVVMTGNGSLNLSALSYDGASGSVSFTQPLYGYLLIGQNSGSHFWTGFTGPSGFGTMGDLTFPTSTSGALVGIAAPENWLILPSSYISGASLATSSSLFENQTFSSMDLQEGVYTWNWGVGASADSFTIQIGQAAAAVPEPATWATMLLGFGLIGGVMRRRQKARVKFGQTVRSSS